MQMGEARPRRPARGASRRRSRTRARPIARRASASVTTRTPESSSVSRCSLIGAVRAVRGPGRESRRACAPPSRSRSAAARAAVAVAAAAAAAVAAATAARPPPPPPLPTAASSSTVLPATSGSSARRRPMRPRSRSTSTTRTLISSPLLRTSSTVVDPLAGRDVRDVQQAVGALGELDERAERRRLDDLAGELVADLDLLGHRPDAVDERVALARRLRVDEHLALVVDVDLRLELLLEAADRLAALADEQADLVGVDLDRGDARRVLRELLARRAR